MKLLHLQIFAGVMAVGLVATGLGAMTIHSSKLEVERKLLKAEGDLKSLRSLGGPIGPVKAPKAPAGGVDYAKENAELSKRIRALEQRAQELERENATLKDAIAKAGSQPAHQKPIPGTPMPEGTTLAGAQPSVPVVDPSVPPAPPVDANETWGSAEDTELDEIVAIAKMSPEQRDQTRQIIRDGQSKFLRLLQEAGAAGEKDITIIEKIGRQVYDESRAGINQILRPDQRAAFDEYLRKQEELR